MKVRDIKFVELETRYEGWQSQIDIFDKESGQSYGCIGFDHAEQYLTSHDYLDRECEIQLTTPVNRRLEKFVRLIITIEPKPYTKVTTNEERKMKVKEIDFKKLQKENEKYSLTVVLQFDEETHGTAKQYDSFTAVKNYLTSHPRWFDYAESDCDISHQETWDGIRSRLEKNYIFRIRLKKKETPKIPYYQFCKGNICNVNGTTYAPEIKDVIFNPPATIVKWADGTKSVVKADNSEAYDPEKGLAMAIARKMYGNKYDYYNVFKKWLKKFDANAAKKALARVAKSVVNAWGTEPVSNGFRELEETDIKLQQLTGYDSKRLLDLFAEGFTLVKECNLISEENKELVNCKDCAHFAPLPSNDPWEDDGICELDGKGTYGMNTCDKAAKKDD